MVPNHKLDPHVFLGHVANGMRMTLAATNPSGTLWYEEWRKDGDGYRREVVGPVGSSRSGLTYEEAYAGVRSTMETLRGMRS